MCARVWGLGFRAQGIGFRILELKSGDWVLGFRIQGSEFRVQSSGFRVEVQA